ncbi:MAG: DinB family protein [Dehalococcoidia bacterium]
MDARSLALFQLDFAKDFYDYALGGVDDALANQASPGNLATIARIYVHPWIALDEFMHTLSQGQPRLWESGGWAAMTGGPADPEDWTTPIALRLDAFKEYRSAVIAAAQHFLTSAPDALLAKEVDTPLGRMPVMTLVAGVGMLHLGEHIGDIATLKGVRGIQGLPF